MSRLKACALSLILISAVFATACDKICVAGCGTLKPGTIVEYVDAENNVHTFTADENGCVRFTAPDCGEYEAISIIAPEAPPVS
ncbi:MAG TPA: hypothetical protein VFS10_07480 [Pyrinomonadaceae bacterium]|nr:hypothetical protein [Pyrinomonadaceae bacterium]